MQHGSVLVKDLGECIRWVGGDEYKASTEEALIDELHSIVLQKI